MYLNRLIREDRDRQIENLSKGKEYSQVEGEIAEVEMVSVSKNITFHFFAHIFKSWHIL